VSAVRRAGRRTQLVGCVVTAQLRVDAAWGALKWGVVDEAAAARYLRAERDLDACKGALEQYELDATVAA